jgi:hypothetical protein
MASTSRSLSSSSPCGGTIPNKHVGLPRHPFDRTGRVTEAIEKAFERLQLRTQLVRIRRGRDSCIESLGGLRRSEGISCSCCLLKILYRRNSLQASVDAPCLAFFAVDYERTRNELSSIDDERF